MQSSERAFSFMMEDITDLCADENDPVKRRTLMAQEREGHGRSLDLEQTTADGPVCPEEGLAPHHCSQPQWSLSCWLGTSWGQRWQDQR